MAAPHTESWLTGPHSTKIYTRTYKAENPKAILVFVHGFGEHIGRYEHVHPLFADRGITVFCYDQRGFGKTALDKENKSKDSVFGRTSWKDQTADIEWAIKHARNEFGELPTFLMGHSMGGGLALAFPTRLDSPPEKSTVALLSGVIVSSPFICLANPPPKIMRWIGGKASLIFPHKSHPAPVQADALTHDPLVNEAYLKDPLVKGEGSLQGISDMLDGGEDLLQTSYQRWPKTLPIFILHGDADKVTSYAATKEMSEKLPAEDKKMSTYPGGYHELHNEPDGVKEKVVEECIAFIESHLEQPPDVGSSKL